VYDTINTTAEPMTNAVLTSEKIKMRNTSVTAVKNVSILRAENRIKSRGFCLEIAKG
jgi:hypothetical protein